MSGTERDQMLAWHSDIDPPRVKIPINRLDRIVACSLAKDGRYSAVEIKAAIDELLDELRLVRH